MTHDEQGGDPVLRRRAEIGSNQIQEWAAPLELYEASYLPGSDETDEHRLRGASVPKEGAETVEPIPLHARLILVLADGLQWTQICATLD
ncbi:MAG: hypothetical protein ABIR36_15755 [Nitrospiraceae bacterium]